MQFKKLLPVLCLAVSMTVAVPMAAQAAGTSTTLTKAATGWQTDESGTYYVLSDGTKANGFVTIGNSIYYFNNSYLAKNTTNGSVVIGGKRYFLTTDGVIKTGLFSVKVSGRTHWYYADVNGVLATNKTVTVNGKVYLFDKTGMTPIPGLYKVGSKRYLVTSAGNCQVGRKKYNGKVYYFGNDGAMIIGSVKYKGKLYFTNENGTQKTAGWMKTSTGKKYYISTKGTLTTGWKKIGKKWYFFDRNSGVMAKNKWIVKSGLKCRVGANGALKLKWYKVNGTKYYGTPSGSNLGARYTGVHQIGSHIYVFSSGGKMIVGWGTYKGTKYYTNSNGYVTRGMRKINGKYYFFNDYGEMVTGWLYHNQKYYYFDKTTGAMVTGTKTIDGTTYSFSRSGVSNRTLDGSWTVKVNRKANVVTVYKGGVPVRAMVCSTGADNATPLGTFTIQDKLPTWVLNGPTYGYYCSHITSDILFHSIPQHELGTYQLPAYKYNMLGSQASQGCIRLSMSDAYWLYNNVPVGSTVIVYDSSNPGPLGKPTGIKIPTSQNYDPTNPSLFNVGR